MEFSAAEVIGLRFPGERRLVWYRAGGLEAPPGAYLVAPLAGGQAVGQVIVAAGQCLSYPADPALLPLVLRPARSEERPVSPAQAGRALLDSLP